MRPTTELVHDILLEIDDLAGSSATNHATVLNIAALLILMARAEKDEACAIAKSFGNYPRPGRTDPEEP